MQESGGSWTQLVFAPTVCRRALKYAIVVGTILILINHGDAILRGDLSPARLIRMLLTIVVPYTVSTLSSVEAMRQRRGGIPDPPPAHPSRAQP
jgi:hypothetical protein